MKKLTITLALLVIVARSASAQFLFGQQGKLRRVMTEQVAQLQFYSRVLKTGYGITQHGLSLNTLLKDTTFNRHNSYLASLKQVPVVVQDNAKTTAIPEMSEQITKLFAAELRFQQQERRLSVKELRYFVEVSANMDQECRAVLGRLEKLTQGGELQLTDQARLEQLDRLYREMKDKLAFTGSFVAKSHQLALARKQGSAERQQVRTLYGLPN